MSVFDPSIPNAAPIGSVLNYNETTFDYERNNTDQVLMSSRSVSASTAVSVTNFNGRGLYAFMNITSAFPASGSTTYTLKVKLIPPNATASAVTVCAAPARSTSGMSVICMYPAAIPGSASAATGVTNCGYPVPRNFQIVASASFGATSKEVVMSLGLSIIL